MMSMRRLVSYISAEPFRPLRIKMTSGETFEIRHPEMNARFPSSSSNRLNRWMRRFNLANRVIAFPIPNGTTPHHRPSANSQPDRYDFCLR